VQPTRRTSATAWRPWPGKEPLLTRLFSSTASRPVGARGPQAFRQSLPSQLLTRIHRSLESAIPPPGSRVAGGAGPSGASHHGRCAALGPNSRNGRRLEGESSIVRPPADRAGWAAPRAAGQPCPGRLSHRQTLTELCWVPAAFLHLAVCPICWCRNFGPGRSDAAGLPASTSCQPDGPARRRNRSAF